MSPTPRRRSLVRQGFTLIELMIVVAIIGLLATVALPQFQNVMLRSKRIERESMVHSILHVLNDYANTHNGQLPGGATVDLPRNPNFAPDGSKRPFDMTVGHWADLGWVPDGQVYYRYSIANLGADKLVITAEADLNNNSETNLKTYTYQLQDGAYQALSEVESGDLF